MLPADEMLSLLPLDFSEFRQRLRFSLPVMIFSLSPLLPPLRDDAITITPCLTMPPLDIAAAAGYFRQLSPAAAMLMMPSAITLLRRVPLMPLRSRRHFADTL